MSSERRRVLVVNNKYWECDPVINVLLSIYATPPNFPWANDPKPPHRRRRKGEALPPENPHPEPRLTLSFTSIDVEVWCISDLMEHLPEEGRFQSASRWKMEYMPRLFQGNIDLVIAMGTAGHPGDGSLNGCVTIGTNVFIHNGGEGSDTSNHWTDGRFGQVLVSRLLPEAFTAFLGNEKASAVYFQKSRNFPYETPQIFADYDAAALSFVNVWDYTAYTVKDKEAEDAFRAAGTGKVLRSVETTHGLIRSCCGDDVPFLFVSGITDRSQYFDDDVKPNEYAQNTTAAHNAGIAIAWMLPKIDATSHFA